MAIGRKLESNVLPKPNTVTLSRHLPYFGGFGPEKKSGCHVTGSRIAPCAMKALA